MIDCRRPLAALILMAAMAEAPALAQGAKASSPVELARKAEALEPGDFYARVHTVIEPGTTVLVTQSSVGASTGQKITILDAVNPAP
jgi:hypothetical protein